jgi:hydrogenase nickel incorporation protein HypA/HybF
MCEGILDAALRRAAGRRLRRVKVRVGTMHRIVPDAMDQAFELVSMGTEADGAALELVLVPITIACQAPGCGRRSETDEPLGTCPACGGTELELEGGDELLLESIELAPGEPALAEGSAHVPGHPG